MNRRFTAGLAASALLISSVAFAQASPPSLTPSASYFGNGITDVSLHPRPSEITVMAFLPYYLGIGIGATVRYSYPILPDGFIPAINDSFDLEGGLSFAYGSYPGITTAWTVLDPHVMGTWRFYVLPNLDVYGGLALGASVFLYSGYAGTAAYVPAAFFWDIAAGVHYRFSSAVELRAEVGYAGVQIGVALPL